MQERVFEFHTDVALNTIEVDIDAETEIFPEMLWVRARIVWRDHGEDITTGRAFQRHQGYVLVYPSRGWCQRAWMWLPEEDLEILPPEETPRESFW
ncbi:hypothetical protein [Timonella senegalensis]|uniref:hypothetical protein n=1 Tax=Timonella senegalensis TaxID=1465825 RepID=UPI0012B56752|nr:hypothetical protein [Timonella senegalensis]